MCLVESQAMALPVVHIVVLECGFKLRNKVGEGPHGYDGSRDGILPKGGCPSEG